MNEVLQRWKELAAETSPEPWEREDAFGFFQRFRPHGAGVERAFRGIAGGDEVLGRLRPVYAVTADGWEQAGTVDAYFVVRRPVPATRAELEAYGRAHVAALRSIAEHAGSHALTAVLARASVAVTVGTTPEQGGASDLAAEVYDTTADWIASLRPSDDRIHDLDEAFYSVACSYELAWYLMWPWYRAAASAPEPFAAAFELWRRGVTVRLEDSGRLCLVPPETTPTWRLH